MEYFQQLKGVNNHYMQRKFDSHKNHAVLTQSLSSDLINVNFQNRQKLGNRNWNSVFLLSSRCTAKWQEGTF